MKKTRREEHTVEKSSNWLTHPPTEKRRAKAENVRRVRDAHVAAVQKELSITPRHGKPDIAEARWLVLEYGLEHAVELAGAYPTLDDPWLRNKGYPLRLIRRNVDAVELALKGGGGRRFGQVSNRDEDWSIPWEDD
jgi:hypothetical protein